MGIYKVQGLSTRLQRFLLLTFYILLQLTLFSNNSLAQLKPEHIAVIYNLNEPESELVAKKYAELRGLSKNQLIALSTNTYDRISRKGYEEHIVKPLRKALIDRKLELSTRVILSVYGIPLSVDAPIKNNTKDNQILVEERLKARSGLEKICADLQKNTTNDGFKPSSLKELNEKDLIAKSYRLLKKALESAQKIDDPALKKKSMKQIKANMIKVGGLSNLEKSLTASAADNSNNNLLKLRKQIFDAKRVLSLLPRLSGEKNKKRLYSLTEKVYGLAGLLEKAGSGADRKKTKKETASVDSELTFLWLDSNQYSLSGRASNPFYHAHLSKHLASTKPFPLLMTSRIDAPTAKRAIMIVEESILAEKKGLSGKVYFDSRGLKLEKNNAKSVWDNYISDSAGMVKNISKYKVEHENTESLLKKADSAAMYIGWYSVRKFKGDFDFSPGSIGYHIASAEAVSVHQPSERGWCKNMLERGIAVTLGAVSEPYLSAFPHPKEFLALVFSGRYSMVESYFLTKKFSSWQMVLFGDPLYNPFKNKSIIEEKQLKDLLSSADSALNKFPAYPSSMKFLDPKVSRAKLSTQMKAMQNRVDKYFSESPN